MNEISQKEIDVLSGLRDGKTVKQIAHAMGIAERTVDYYSGKTKKKLGAKTLSHSTAIALALGIIKPVTVSKELEERINANSR